MRRRKSGRAQAGFRAAARNPYWREGDARAVLEGWASSGLEVEEFARRHGLSAGRLRRWSERLGPRRRMGFHPVEVTLDGVSARLPVKSDGGVAVVLRGGRQVAVGQGFDEELLARVVRVVESLPC